MNDSRNLKLRLSAKYSTLGSGTVTHVYRLRWGGLAGTLLCATGTVTVLISMSNAAIEIEITIQTRSNGTAGSIMANGWSKTFGGTAPTLHSATGAPAVSPMTNGGQTGPAAATGLDLSSTDISLALTLQHGASSASNTATTNNYEVFSQN
jgi:hypothetical protein